MNFSLDVNLSAITVFLQGLLSFFSPCILPLLPLYAGYLSAGAKAVEEEGDASKSRGRTLVNTLFFVLGISFAFLLLGVGMTAFGHFFRGKQTLFSRIGAVCVFFFGLYQLGVFGKIFLLERERRLPLRLDQMAMSPVTAFLMGFTFSFAWTPCVGPALASVLILVSTASTQAAGMALMGVYTLGFALPFLAVGLFAASLPSFFKKHGQIVKYTVKAGGVLMLVMGILLFTGKMNALSGYLAAIPAPGKSQGQNPQENASTRAREEMAEENASPATEKETGSAPGTEEAAEQKTGAERGTKAEPKTGTEQGTTAEQKIDAAQRTEAAQAADAEQAVCEADSDTKNLPPAPDFTLTDQYGKAHTLSDYKGKTVFLNFWATWCPPCRAEMPDIQKIYNSYLESGDDSLVILGVAGPGQGQETTVEGIWAFLKENGYTYPVLMDKTGEQFMQYGISALPTTYMIDREGNVFGYVSGQLNEEMMRGIIEQTMEGKRR